MSDLDLTLPTLDGRLERHRLGERPPVQAPHGTRPRSRVAYAAGHVVADPMAAHDPALRASVDWDATLAFRRHLWSLGLGVAEAMDTAQRGMGLDWPAVQELIRRSIAEARASDGDVVCGVTTDQLGPGQHDRAAVAAAYEEQLAFVDELGGRAVLMASRQLARVARGPEDYLEVYGGLLSGARRPVVLHWLGEMFDPALACYWGFADPWQAMDVVVELVQAHAASVDGIKVSLLEESFEVALRRRLPAGVRCYTGDDFNYPRLIAGDEQGHSHALLGIFDAIAPVAAAALHALDEGDLAGYEELLAPTVPLSRHLFATPTYHYKTGIVFLAYLNGHQDHFRMVGGQESARSLPHLAEIVRLADSAGVLADPELAARRLRHVLALGGVEA